MASILKVDALQGVTAAGDITITSEGGAATQSLQQGLSKAFCEATDAAVLRDSSNIASGTDVGTGHYNFAFTNNMSNANFSCPCSASQNTSVIVNNAARSTSYYEIEGFNRGTGSQNDKSTCSAVFGDLA